jgi:hypothetical protein
LGCKLHSAAKGCICVVLQLREAINTAISFKEVNNCKPYAVAKKIFCHMISACVANDLR